MIAGQTFQVDGQHKRKQKKNKAHGSSPFSSATGRACLSILYENATPEFEHIRLHKKLVVFIAQIVDTWALVYTT